MSNLDWMDNAACRDHDADLFFPNSTGIAAQLQAERAARVCASCPVQDACAAHRKRTGASTGVWGGSYHKTKPPGKHLKPIDHGTNGGYNQHLDRGEVPCERCRFGHAHHRRKWLESKRRPA